MHVVCVCARRMACVCACVVRVLGAVPRRRSGGRVTNAFDAYSLWSLGACGCVVWTASRMISTDDSYYNSTRPSVDGTCVRHGLR